MTMRTARFQVYKAKDGWRWRLLAANNRQIAQGEAHTRKADAIRAASLVRQTARSAECEATKVAYYPWPMTVYKWK